MIVLLALLAGALIGILRARQLGGRAADMAQYGVAYGLIFAIISLIGVIAYLRLA